MQRLVRSRRVRGGVGGGPGGPTWALRGSGAWCCARYLLAVRSCKLRCHYGSWTLSDNRAIALTSKEQSRPPPQQAMRHGLTCVMWCASPNSALPDE